MLVEINTQPENLLLPEKTEEILRTVLQKTAEQLDLGDDTEVSLVISDNATIRALNREYRDKDAVTDVLSFPLEEDLAGSVEPDVIGGPQERMLGDIVISIDKAVAQAQEYGHSLERELAFLTVHGMLHLLGHDHEGDSGEAKIMRQEEKRILGALGIPR